MAKKTLVKRVLKYAPMATERALQIESDTTIKRFDPAESDAMSDLSLVADSTVIEGEYEETQTDPTTGEVIENA